MRMQMGGVYANERKMDCYLGQKSLKMEVRKQV